MIIVNLKQLSWVGEHNSFLIFPLLISWSALQSGSFMCWTMECWKPMCKRSPRLTMVLSWLRDLWCSWHYSTKFANAIVLAGWVQEVQFRKTETSQLNQLFCRSKQSARKSCFSKEILQLCYSGCDAVMKCVTLVFISWPACVWTIIWNNFHALFLHIHGFTSPNLFLHEVTISYGLRWSR